MTDTNNTDGAALLPVTPEDYDLADEIRRHLGETGQSARALGPSYAVVQMIAAFRQSHPLPGDVGIDNERKVILQNKRVNDAIQTALERGELTVSSDGYLAALTPQRQEYDGEAVREALEQNRGPLADAARQIAVRFGVGGEGQASAYAAAKDAILAALAHPAQATPSALSGDGRALCSNCNQPVEAHIPDGLVPSCPPSGSDFLGMFDGPLGVVNRLTQK